MCENGFTIDSWYLPLHDNRNIQNPIVHPANQTEFNLYNRLHCMNNTVNTVFLSINLIATSLLLAVSMYIYAKWRLHYYGINYHKFRLFKLMIVSYVMGCLIYSLSLGKLSINNTSGIPLLLFMTFSYFYLINYIIIQSIIHTSGNIINKLPNFNIENNSSDNDSVIIISKIRQLNLIYITSIKFNLFIAFTTLMIACFFTLVIRGKSLLILISVLLYIHSIVIISISMGVFLVYLRNYLLHYNNGNITAAHNIINSDNNNNNNNNEFVYPDLTSNHIQIRHYLLSALLFFIIYFSIALILIHTAAVQYYIMHLLFLCSTIINIRLFAAFLGHSILTTHTSINRNDVTIPSVSLQPLINSTAVTEYSNNL